MQLGIAKATILAGISLFLVGFLSAQVKVVVDWNPVPKATPEFKFEHVPPPSKDDAGSHAQISVIVGREDGNGGGTAALNDGKVPSSADDPQANFFFAAGTDGGRILMDLGQSMAIAAVNTYSWHPSDRGPQVYNLFVSDGTGPRFVLQPDENTDPATCGWKLVATVDTRPMQAEGGGQYGVSVTDASGTLGTFRYLLFDAVPTEWDDPFGNTFYSEIDVIAAH